MFKQAEPNQSTGDLPAKVSASEGSNMVMARVPQGYDTEINIRLLPGKEISFTRDILGCHPRQGAPRRDADPLPLPESLPGKLKDANKKVVDWLAQDPANARLFLASPVEALAKAGVELTRAEQKALDRTHRAMKEATVIAPGVKVSQLSTSVSPKGRVGDSKSSSRPKGGRTEDAGCVSEGKG